MALGALGGAAIRARWRRCASAATMPVLRYLATRELAALAPAPGVDPRPALRAALDDRDPRVRETAALALGKQPRPGAGAVLIAGAKQEPWPFVRRAELEALGRLCVPGAADLMIRARSSETSTRCAARPGRPRALQGPRARNRAAAKLASDNEAATVRELAAALLGESGDQGAAPQLATALRGLVSESEADLALEGVAATTLRALARLGGPDARGAAVTLAVDKRHPFRSTAVEALGMLCDPGAGRRRYASSRRVVGVDSRSPRRTPRSTAAGGETGLGAAAHSHLGVLPSRSCWAPVAPRHFRDGIRTRPSCRRESRPCPRSLWPMSLVRLPPQASSTHWR